MAGDEEGRFVRSGTTFRDFVTADDSSGFRAEAGRYHLYISWTCPWVHRTVILRKLKGLEDAVSLAVVGSFMGDDGWAFCPEDLREEVDRTLDELYEPVNNGVYKTGFATTQNAYEEAVTELFSALGRWEGVLSKLRYLCGERITEADWAFFATLMRFDAVYYGHFKCNLRRIVDYPNLWSYLKDLYQQPGVAETVDLGHIKRHYYGSHESINPTRIVPKGPLLNFDEPHERERLPG